MFPKWVQKLAGIMQHTDARSAMAVSLTSSATGVHVPRATVPTHAQAWAHVRVTKPPTRIPGCQSTVLPTGTSFVTTYFIFSPVVYHMFRLNWIIINVDTGKLWSLSNFANQLNIVSWSFSNLDCSCQKLRLSVWIKMCTFTYKAKVLSF